MSSDGAFCCLRRLGLDHIPVVYVHDPPAAICERVIGPGAVPDIKTPCRRLTTRT